jgi:hypothetical protein
LLHRPITSVLWLFFFIHYALHVTISAAANSTIGPAEQQAAAAAAGI